MPEEIEKINEIFRIHEEIEKTAKQKKVDDSAVRAAADAAKDDTGTESAAAENEYTEEELTERDYRPVRRSREYRSGCLGGLMYFVFITCVSIILACVVRCGRPGAQQGAVYLGGHASRLDLHVQDRGDRRQGRQRDGHEARIQRGYRLRRRRAEIGGSDPVQVAFQALLPDLKR